jgi:site-specific recombinase XerD/ssDNA-binding Zn-finger/Zn-ribbon topoisomerase 1
VKTLEDLGIGRPSTYAQILGTIQDREYVRRDKGTLFPTELGSRSPTCWCRTFPEVMDVEFTAQLEESLDKIEEGNADWQETVGAFYKEFAKDLAKAGKKMENFKEGVDAGQACPDCGKPLVEKWGRFGKFLACSRIPNASSPRTWEAASGRPTSHRRALPDLRQGHGDQARPLREVHGLLGLSRVQDYQAGAAGNPVSQDGGQLVERRSKRGKTFYACANYPQCTFSVWSRPVAQACPQCGASFVTERVGRGGQDHARVREGRLRLQGRRRAHGRLTDRPPMPDQSPGTPRPDDSPVSAFLQYLAGERGASAHTLRGYATDLAEFRRFLRSARVGDWTNVDARSLRAYLAWLHGRGLARSSIARKLAAVRSCFRFLTRRGVLPANPARHVRTPRLGRRLPSFLPKDESKDLLDAGFEDTDTGRRDRALLELLYACGLRVAECCGLDLEGRGSPPRHGPRAGQGQSRAHGAGGRRGAGGAGSLSRGPRGESRRAQGRGPLFRNPRGQRLTTRSVHRIVGRRARAAGIARRVTRIPAAHLRHPSPRRGGRPARDPGAARAPPPLHHPALHSREPRAPDEGVRRRASPGDVMARPHASGVHERCP